MNLKMNIKLKLAMQLLTLIYILLYILLGKLNLINSSNPLNLLSIIWIIMCFLIMINGKRLEGITDELVISILSKVNKIGITFLVTSIFILSSLLISPLYKDFVISEVAIGICLLLILFVFTAIRLLSFIYLERKGICK